MKKNIIITQHSSATKPLHLQSLIDSTAAATSLCVTIPANHNVHIIDNTNCEKIIFTVLESATLHYHASNAPSQKLIEFHLKEQSAQAFVHYAQQLKQGTTQTLSTTQHHWADNTKSNVMVKNILEAKTQSINQNIIIVEKNLDGVVAEQMNKNLVLDRSAKIKTMPQLQVHSQNAHCVHGATTRGLNPDDLFYAQSRGIEHFKAKELLIKAFLK